jgi:hypothetical protein
LVGENMPEYKKYREEMKEFWWLLLV